MAWETIWARSLHALVCVCVGSSFEGSCNGGQFHPNNYNQAAGNRSETLKRLQLFWFLLFGFLEHCVSEPRYGR